jgi:hypothetical protein
MNVTAKAYNWNRFGNFKVCKTVQLVEISRGKQMHICHKEERIQERRLTLILVQFKMRPFVYLGLLMIA